MESPVAAVTSTNEPEVRLVVAATFDESEVCAETIVVKADEGFDTTTTLDSFDVVLMKVLVTVTVRVSPTATVPVEALTVSVSSIAALEGPEARTPNPKAATTASAIRLKVVLLDIIFLSIVALKTISKAALR
jgi:hypothetical protein